MKQPKIINPCISIDRLTKKYAIFDGFKCVSEFVPYTDESAALTEARNEIAKHTSAEPEIIYPVVRSMRATLKRVTT